MRLIHLFWHDEPPPPAAGQHVADWSALHPGALVRLHGPSELPDDILTDAERSCRHVRPEDHPRHLANIARWYLLGEHGGLWADTDVRPLRPLPDELWESPWCAGQGSVPTPFICASPPAPIWFDALTASLAPRGQAMASPEASGGRMLARVAPGIALLPASRFTARDSSGRRLPDDPDRYTDHEWATSRLRTAGARATGPASGGPTT